MQVDFSKLQLEVYDYIDKVVIKNLQNGDKMIIDEGVELKLLGIVNNLNKLTSDITQILADRKIREIK